MKDVTKIELTQPAHRFVASGQRVLMSFAELSQGAAAVGRSALSLGEQIVRPAIPALDACAKVVEGAAEFYGWTAGRLAEGAQMLGGAAERLKTVRDADEAPTFLEIGDAIRAAEIELMPAPGVEAEDTAPTSGQQLS